MTRFILLRLLFSIQSVSGFEICDVRNQICFKDAKTEIERWDCYGKYLFRTSNNPGRDTYFKHDCHRAGFGNFIRAANNAFDVAALFGRRLILQHEVMHSLWSPPYELEFWDYGYGNTQPNNDRADSHNQAYLDWPKFSMWLNTRNSSDFDYSFDNATHFVKHFAGLKTQEAKEKKSQSITVGMCGQCRREFTLGNCSTRLLSHFGKCYENSLSRTTDRFRRLSDEDLLVPFFHMTFRKPKELLVSSITTIRQRLDLPPLAAGYEPLPGTYGLHTPGYYILALHFRRVPLGFEPHSLDFNNNTGLEHKVSMLKAYWTQAVKIAEQARIIALCRNETLLIYFATDDVRGLRPEAKRLLSSFGEVVFGLTDEEVGHIVTNHWRDEDVEKVKELAAELKRKGFTADHLIGKERHNITVELAVNVASGDHELIVNPSYESSAEVLAKHAYMALVEWWVLGSANWLVSHTGTSYSDTAAGWGLGPNGHMERFDKIHDESGPSTTFRKDWNKEGCPLIFAADPIQAQRCPNNV